MGPKSHLDQQPRKSWPRPQLLAKRLNTTRIGPKFPAGEEKLVGGLWPLLVTWGLQVETVILTLGLLTCSPWLFGELRALLAESPHPTGAGKRWPDLLPSPLPRPDCLQLTAAPYTEPLLCSGPVSQ